MKTKYLFFILLLGFLILSPQKPFLASAVAAETMTGSVEDGVNHRSNYWRAVNDGNQGVTQSRGDGHTVLINDFGQTWRKNKEFQRKAAIWIIPGVLLIIFLTHLIVGTHHLERSGKKVLRFNLFERIIHWITAVAFFVLALTGLTLLLGRDLLIPLLGGENFASIASMTKLIHNYVGPIFATSLLIMILMWVKYNIPRRHDLVWIKALGGFFSKNPPPAGKMNFGEKTWFWIIATVGFFGIVVTGIYMLFPVLGADRETFSWANIIHVIASVITLVISFGHIYIGTKGMEGSLEGMKTGYVDENWVKDHHRLWYDELKEKGK